MRSGPWEEIWTPVLPRSSTSEAILLGLGPSEEIASPDPSCPIRRRARRALLEAHIEVAATGTSASCFHENEPEALCLNTLIGCSVSNVPCYLHFGVQPSAYRAAPIPRISERVLSTRAPSAGSLRAEPIAKMSSASKADRCGTSARQRRRIHALPREEPPRDWRSPYNLHAKS